MILLLNMKTTLQVKLLPSSEQHAALLETMHAFNAACTWIATYAFAQRCASKFQLQKTLYYEVRQRFHLSAQLSIRAIAKTVEAYKRDKSQQVAFRPDGAVVYDERIMAFHGLEAVSLTTLHGRALIPLQMGDYQRVQLHRAKGQADLVLVKGTFFLLVTLDTPVEPPMIPEPFLGIDLGIITLATDSDGNRYSGDDVEVVRQRSMTHRETYQTDWHEECQASSQSHGRPARAVSTLGEPRHRKEPCPIGERHESRAGAGRPDAHPRPDNGSQAPTGEATSLGVWATASVSELQSATCRCASRVCRPTQHEQNLFAVWACREAQSSQSSRILLYTLWLRRPRRHQRGQKPGC